MIISRRSHPLIQHIRSVRDQSTPFAFLEGPRLIDEAIKAGLALDLLVSTADAEHLPQFAGWKRHAKRTAAVSEPIFNFISDVEAPQGILALAERPRWSWEEILKRRPAPLILLDGVQNPGNVAAIVRTAEAAGAAGVVTTSGTAHLFSPKGLRGSMGSALRLPSLEHLEASEIGKSLAAGKFNVYATLMESKSHLRPALAYTSVDWKGACAIIFGQEGSGIRGVWDPLLNGTVTIPMEPPVDSLNVAAAAAILLYEIRRQQKT